MVGEIRTAHALKYFTTFQLASTCFSFNMNRIECAQLNIIFFLQGQNLFEFFFKCLLVSITDQSYL